jgi:site-specific DNA recombinase
MYIISPKSGNRSTYFVCGRSQNRKGDPNRCTTHNIKYDDLCDAVLEDVNSVISSCHTDSKSFCGAVISIVRSNQSDIGSVKAQIDTITAKLNMEKTKFKKLYDDYYKGLIRNAELFEEMTSECNDCIEAYSAKLEKLRNELESSESHICNAGKFVELVKKFSNTDKLSRELLNTLVDRIEVCEKERTESSGVVQNINIYYKFVGELNAV